MRYSPIEDYSEYGGTASQPPGLGASSTPAEYAGQLTAPPLWQGDSAHPPGVWHQPLGASPPTHGAVAPPGPVPTWHQQMHAAHSDLRAAGAVGVGPQSSYPGAGQQVPLAVAAQQAVGHYAHRFAMSHMGRQQPPGHQLPPQPPEYAMQTQPGQMPGQLQALVPQPEDFSHPAQPSAQPQPYSAAQFQSGPGLPQQSGYGPPPSHGSWHPELGGPGAYAQHHSRAPPAAPIYAAGPHYPPALPPPQDGPAHQQPPQPQWGEAPGPAAVPGAGYPAPQLDGYGKQDVLGVNLPLWTCLA